MSKATTLREFSRNVLTNHDAPDMPLTLYDLEPGELFLYANGVSVNNVYMKTDRAGGAVYLPTGAVYETLTDANKVKRVHKVTIQRG